MNNVRTTTAAARPHKDEVPAGTQFSRQFRQKNRAEGRRRVEAYLDQELEEQVVAFGESRGLSRPQAIIRLLQLGLMFEEMRRLAETGDQAEHGEMARA